MSLRTPVLVVPASEDPATPAAARAAYPAPGEPLILIESTPNHAIGTCANVSLYVWRHHTLPSAMPAVVRAFEVARRAGGDRFANFGVVEEAASLPESEMRGRLAHLMRDAADHLVASALVFEGTGFRASAVRTVVTGVALIARQPYPHRAFGSTLAAAEWLVGRMEKRAAPSPSAATIEAAMVALRREPAARTTM